MRVHFDDILIKKRVLRDFWESELKSKNLDLGYKLWGDVGGSEDL